MDPNKTWQAALGDIQLQVLPSTFNTWLKNTRLSSYEDGVFVISTPNPYAVEWLENRLQRLIRNTLTRIVGRSVGLRFIVHTETETIEQEDGPLFSETSIPHSDMERSSPVVTSHAPLNTNSAPFYPLNPRYTFDSFIVGNSNRMAHAASRSVAERLAEAYNPLFIYGGVGLGKTHLLQAVAHAVVARGLRAGYTSSEVFTNELIKSIRHQNTDDFRNRYRSLDVLLIDDIQFIAGKESTQEEFFHTFNTLHGADRQIIISSDRAPRAMGTLEERLRSRFEGGLVVDLPPPEFETRIAILRFKADHQPVQVPDEVLSFIARKIESNIRELEGALTKVIAHSRFLRLPLSVETAELALHDILQKRRSIRLEDITRAVAQYYEIPLTDLLGKRRNSRIVFPRQVAMYLCRELTDTSLPRIGAVIGGRDHTTILYGYEKILKQLEADETLRQDILSIKEFLYETPVHTP